MKFDKLQKYRQQKVTVLLSEVIQKKRSHQRILFLGSFRQKKIQALPKKMGECHDINYVEFVYYVIMYLIINN